MYWLAILLIDLYERSDFKIVEQKLFRSYTEAHVETIPYTRGIRSHDPLPSSQSVNRRVSFITLLC